MAKSSPGTTADGGDGGLSPLGRVRGWRQLPPAVREELPCCRRHSLGLSANDDAEARRSELLVKGKRHQSRHESQPVSRFVKRADGRAEGKRA